MKPRAGNGVRRRLGVLAAASMLAVAGQSWALGLGRVSVQSALGEPLRAEVDVTSLSADEASSLALRIASPEAYRAAGVDYSDLLGTLQVSLERRPDGRPVIRLSSPRAVQEPFLDVILELTWAAGRLVREYTLLVDPPRTAAAAPPAAPVMPPVVAAAPAPLSSPSAGLAPAPAAASAPVAAIPAPSPQAPAPSPMSGAMAVAPAPGPSAVPGPASAPAPARVAPAASVRVKPGDTLGGIARGVQPPGVSLDQMLVALFRSNPQAFIGANLNLVKAGAVLQMPSAAEVAAVSPREARALIVAQSADFAAYRRRLASAAPQAVEAAPSRQASGRVEAAVQDRKEAAAPTGDQLKLSQGAVRPGAEEAKVSRETASRESAARVAELSRNVEELRRLQGAASAARPGGVALPGTGGTVAPAPATTPAPAQSVSPATAAASVPPVRIPEDRRPDPEPPLAVSPSASVPGVAGPAQTVASAPAAAPPPVKRVPAPAPAPQPAQEPSFLDSLTEDNPLLLPAAGGLLALLVGLGAWRMRGRFSRRGSGRDSAAFGESKLQADSFFGGTGGGRVDTQEGMSRAGQGASSMGYSLSQLDAIGDVDPVAEADVYLAYGRDLQAEEILKEALRAHPERLAIKTKLLEVYAKRRDVRAFEVLAAQVYLACDGQGEEWQKVQEQGRAIDPGNSLYQPGGKPDPQRLESDSELDSSAAATQQVALQPSTYGEGSDAVVGLGRTEPGLDLDLDLGESELPPALAAQRGGDGAPGPLDFDLSAISLDLESPPAPAPAAAAGRDSAQGADGAPATRASTSVGAPAAPAGVAVAPEPAAFELPSLDFDLSVSPQETAPEAPAFELPAFELPDAPAEAVELSADGDPLVRKIELAEEFEQIGDQEGARELLTEVLAQADGELKARAQALLARLG